MFGELFWRLIWVAPFFGVYRVFIVVCGDSIFSICDEPDLGLLKRIYDDVDEN